MVFVTSIIDCKYNCLSQNTLRNLSLGPYPTGIESKYHQHLQDKAGRAATRLYIKLHFPPCLSPPPLTAVESRKNMCCTFNLGHHPAIGQGEILGFLTICINIRALTKDKRLNNCVIVHKMLDLSIENVRNTTFVPCWMPKQAGVCEA